MDFLHHIPILSYLLLKPLSRKLEKQPRRDAATIVLLVVLLLNMLHPHGLEIYEVEENADLYLALLDGF